MVKSLSFIKFYFRITFFLLVSTRIISLRAPRASALTKNMSIIDSIHRLLLSAFLFVRVFILRLSLFFVQQIEYRTLPARLSDATRTVLLIGDGTAEGVGDNLGHTGLTSSLNSLLRTTRNDHNLRLSWRVVTAGRLYTSSADWLPASPLFRKAFTSGVYRDAHVVVVALGMHDDLSAADHAPIVENVMIIVQALVTMRKVVVVPLFPNFHPRRSDAYAAVARANTTLREQLTTLVAAQQSATVVYDCDMAKISSLGGDVTMAEDGFYTFNSRGYRLLAADLFEDVVLAAKKVEWVHWKDRLSGR